MRKRMGTRLLSVLVALAMAVGLTPGMSLTAYADYAAIWTKDLVISKDTTIDGGVAVSTDSDIKLTFENGATLIVNGGITAGTRTVTVEGKGSLVVNGADVNTVGATGDKGPNGTDGTYAQNCGGTGASGGKGGDGGVGIEANLVVNDVTVTVTGGKGGKGGTGGDGGNGFGGGQGQERRPGGSGGTGGAGGAGGAGVKGSVTVNSGSITVTGGAGGDGGDGGKAGAYGNGSFPPDEDKRPHPGGKGADGAAGQAVTGTITGYEDAQESDDGSAWTVVSGNASTKRYVKVVHLHSFTYSANGDTITATCGKKGCDLTDNQATLTIAKPTLETYGQTGTGISASATLTGLEAFNAATGKTIAATDVVYVGRDGTTYAESATAPTNAGKYTAKITLDGVKTGAGDNQSVTASVDYEIAKAAPAIPTGLTATYGQKLSDVALTDGWAWADGTQGVGSVGSHTFKANFTPTDANYNAKSDVGVSVTVDKAANPATVAGTASVTKGGKTVDLSKNVTMNGATGTVSYAIGGEAKGCTIDGDGVLTSGESAGPVTVNVTVAEDDNYNALAATPIAVTINDKADAGVSVSGVPQGEVLYLDEFALTASAQEPGANGSWTWKSSDTGVLEVTGNGENAVINALKAGSATVTASYESDTTVGEAATGAITVHKVEVAAPAIASKVYNGQPQAADVPESTLYTVKTNEGGTNVGNYDVVLTLSDPTNYKWADSEEAAKTLAFEITKANAVAATVTANDRTYDGAEGPLVNVDDSTLVGGTMRYALGEDATKVPAADAWSEDVPTGTDAGTYHVWYKVEGDANHNDTAPECVDASIRRPAPSKVNIARAEVTADPASFAYDGTAKEPALKVTLGGRELAEGTDYVASFSGNVEAGTATATVTGKGRYTGAAKATFAIEPADVSKAQVKLAQDSFAYDGKAKEPAVVSVTLGGRTLEAGTDYSVSYENNVEAGTAHAVVTGKGNYEGTAEAAFSIEQPKPPVPVRTDISKAKVTLAKKKLAYDGKAKEPAVASVVLNGKTLAAGTDYAVTYEGNTEPGTARAIVTGKGAYEGAAKASFKVALKKAKLSATSKPAAGSLAANWAAVPGAEGYELQWREPGGQWQAKSVSATSATVKGLKPGSLCDVRVRAVAGKAKGAWSPVRHRWLARTLGVTAKAGKRGTVDVTWKASPEATAGYLVVARYAKGGKNAAKLKVAPGNTSATFTGLKSGKKVWVLVAPLRTDSGKTFRGVLSHTTRSTATVR